MTILITLAVILAAILIPVLIVWGICRAFTYSKDLLPEYLKTKKHNDWFWPLSLIPRIWTSFVLPFPPHVMFGNAKQVEIAVQPGYPLADDVVTAGANKICSAEPVHPCGQWSVQSVKLRSWTPRIPCYFTFTKALWGRRLYFNMGIKPDVTTGDWHWGFPEMSLTFNPL